MLQRLAITVLCLCASAAGHVTFAASNIFVAANTAGGQDKEKTPTAEQVAETAIYFHGRRESLAQIRRNGVERGRLTRTLDDGKTEEVTYERRFVRGESVDKDKLRLDQKTSSAEYSLIYGNGRVWGIIGGATFTPRQEATSELLAPLHHGIDALLRYKENGATLDFVGKDKQKNVNLWVLDLTDKEKRRTRYYISAKLGRVLWLEYEQAPPTGGESIKYRREFHDYRYAQGTLVPFRSVLYAGNKTLQENRILTVTYGVRMDDELFRNPDSAAAAATP